MTLLAVKRSSASVSKTRRQALGMTPMWTALEMSPSMVYVFPVPVCPKANTCRTRIDKGRER